MSKKEVFDREIYKKICSGWDAIAKPVDGLGSFEELISRIGAIQKTETPSIDKRCVLVMCGDNGIVEEGVSQTGKEVTYSVASWMGKNESSVCRLAKKSSTDVFAVDIGMDSDDTPEGVLELKVIKGTRNFLKEPALTEDECRKAIDTGIELVKRLKDEGYKLIASGEMGIGNTTTAAALAEIFFGDGTPLFVGRGAGLDDEKLNLKKQVVKKAYELYASLSPFEALRSIGGADIAALTGVFIGGARYGIPVIIDGSISAVAAACAEMLEPGTKWAMLPSHIGKEAATKAALSFLELDDLAVIHASLALGEGTGAVMLIPLLDMALSFYENALRFDNTTVDRYERFSK